MQLVSLWGREGEMTELYHNRICYRKVQWKENSEHAIAQNFVLTLLMASIVCLTAAGRIKLMSHELVLKVRKLWNCVCFLFLAGRS